MPCKPQYMFYVICQISRLSSGLSSLATEGHIGLTIDYIYIIPSLWDTTRESHTRSIRHLNTEQYFQHNSWDI